MATYITKTQYAENFKLVQDNFRNKFLFYRITNRIYADSNVYAAEQIHCVSNRSML